MSYKGRYSPSYPQKYKGNPSNIIYRSLWERKFMVFCDLSENIVEWGSEEIVIPYRSPIDNRVHRYFPDFYVKLRETTGKIKKYIIEVKPKKQLKTTHFPHSQHWSPPLPPPGVSAAWAGSSAAPPSVSGYRPTLPRVGGQEGGGLQG